MRKFLTGAAILALVATAASAKPGDGPGRGGDAGKGSPHTAGSPGGSPGGAQPHAAAPGKDRRAAKGGDGPTRGEARGRTESNQDGRERGEGRQERTRPTPPNLPERTPRSDDRARGQGNREFVGQQSAASRAADRRDERPDTGKRTDFRADRAMREDGRAITGRPSFRRAHGPIDGCPPGLAKKANGCRPPGLAAKPAARNAALGAAGASLLAATYPADWFGYPDYGPDYRYYDGYLLRTSGDRVVGYVPLLGGALSVGAPWPAYYEPEPLPQYWTDYYDLGDPRRYRYYDDVIYELNPGGSDIEAIVALIAGDPWAVGQPMPVGYDIYNVPYAYRDRYYDGPDHWYRYSDGYVYDIDPTTRLVRAVLQLLA